MKRLPQSALAFGLAVAVSLDASPQPSPLFSDHAVLQRDVLVPVWGTAQPGESVRVSLGEMTASTKADDEGHWRVNLPPMKAAPGSTLTIEGESTFTAEDVAVGDVWLLTGQSNMAFQLSQADGGEDAAAQADYPWLRQVKPPHRVTGQPEELEQAAWVPATPKSAPGFSAVGFFFARDLYGDGTVPVGLLNVSRGGSLVEAWMGPAAIASAENGLEVEARWQAIVDVFPPLKEKYDADYAAWKLAKQKADADGTDFTQVPPKKPQGPGRDTQPGGLYNGMMAPVMPYAARGVIWYQGESNVVRPGEYADLLSAMIADWRRGFENPDLPFFIVQLPNYDDRRYSWSDIRLAQAEAAAADPNAYLAVTVDIGEPRDKHPRNKAEVGRRLALLVRKNLLGEAVVAEAPALVTATSEEGQVILTFDTGESELLLIDSNEETPSFEVAGENGDYQPAAMAHFEDGVLVLACPGIAEPSRVRYLGQSNPFPVLFGSSGLPVPPFEVTLP